jgi:DNA mismatch repair ATPase MutS
MWHPLIARPVANDVAIAAGEGLIVTGSNMSGKTTYLRTLGVTAVMAQTINTCPASVYRAPSLVIRTSIGRDDSLSEGKSYYMAEAESVLVSVAASTHGAPCLFLFDELFRGTNLVERLAAGEAALRTLLAPHPSHFAVVATHDGELVDLVAGLYRPVHFDGRLEDGELRFDFHVRPGRAMSRNAIALLQQLGAPASLIDRATTRAAELDARHQRN